MSRQLTEWASQGVGRGECGYTGTPSADSPGTSGQARVGRPGSRMDECGQVHQPTMGRQLGVDHVWPHPMLRSARPSSASDPVDGDRLCPAGSARGGQRYPRHRMSFNS